MASKKTQTTGTKTRGNVQRGGAKREPAAPSASRTSRTGPSARVCPLVLDGEMAPADFSPSQCVTCDEFDCRFCEAEAGSGALRSRLFAGNEGGGEEDDEWNETFDDPQAAPEAEDDDDDLF